MHYIALKSVNLKDVRLTIGYLYSFLNSDKSNYEICKDKFTIYKSLEYHKVKKDSFFAIFRNKNTSKLILISNYGRDLHNIISAENIGNKEKCNIVVTGCLTEGRTVQQLELLDEKCRYVRKSTSNIFDALTIKTLI